MSKNPKKITSADIKKKIPSSILSGHIWQVLAIFSLLVNLVFVAGAVYVLKYSPIELARLNITYNCSDEGYARIMKQSQSHEEKKFAAAALCFTDYDTGKPLDIESLKPKSNSPATLPPNL